MHLGDSATFILDGETFYQYFMGEPFPFKNKKRPRKLLILKIEN
jgi:hypothetical protein